MGSQSSFDHVHVGDPGLSYHRGVNHLLTMCMLNLNCKILGEILVCHTGWSQSSFDHVHVES